jgi:hypothetical protein
MDPDFAANSSCNFRWRGRRLELRHGIDRELLDCTDIHAQQSERLARVRPDRRRPGRLPNAVDRICMLRDGTMAIVELMA